MDYSKCSPSSEENFSVGSTYIRKELPRRDVDMSVRQQVEDAAVLIENTVENPDFGTRGAVLKSWQKIKLPDTMAFSFLHGSYKRNGIYTRDQGYTDRYIRPPTYARKPAHRGQVLGSSVLNIFAPRLKYEVEVKCGINAKDAIKQLVESTLRSQFLGRHDHDHDHDHVTTLIFVKDREW